MKTRIYLLTALALIIQVMVSGQTPGSLALPQDNFGLGLKYENKGTTKKTMDGKEIIGQDNVAERTAPASKQSSTNLKQQAEELSLKSRYLREAAVNNTGLTKTELMNEANALYKQAEMMFITALELSGVKNNEAYLLNKSNINQLLEKNNLSAMTGKQIQSLVSDAEMNMRFAREMREEANAMPTNAGKLGSLSNADEKETLAIGEQNQALNLLKGLALNISGIDISNLATK